MANINKQVQNYARRYKRAKKASTQKKILNEIILNFDLKFIHLFTLKISYQQKKLK